MFDRAEFSAMATRLAALKGRFILSLNDRTEVREIFAAFDFDEVSATYTVGGGGKARPAAELIISGGG